MFSAFKVRFKGQQCAENQATQDTDSRHSYVLTLPGERGPTLGAAVTQTVGDEHVIA